MVLNYGRIGPLREKKKKGENIRAVAWMSECMN
jgi:hypothetical protein